MCDEDAPGAPIETPLQEERVSDWVLRETARRLETGHYPWRVKMGMGLFRQIIEDVLECADRRPSLLHSHCVPSPQYRELEGRYSESYQSLNDTIDQLKETVTRLEKVIADHE